jgi:hypothetical protein
MIEHTRQFRSSPGGPTMDSGGRGEATYPTTATTTKRRVLFPTVLAAMASPFTAEILSLFVEEDFIRTFQEFCRDVTKWSLTSRGSGSPFAGKLNARDFLLY